MDTIIRYAIIHCFSMLVFEENHEIDHHILHNVQIIFLHVDTNALKLVHRSGDNCCNIKEY